MRQREGFSPVSKRTIHIVLVLAAAAGLVTVWHLVSTGLWLAPLIVSAVWALGVPWPAWQYWGALVLSLGGYGLSLGLQALSEPLGRSADVVASIMGFGHTGIIVWAFTFLLAALMAVAGAWLGHAIRVLWRPS